MLLLYWLCGCVLLWLGDEERFRLFLKVSLELVQIQRVPLHLWRGGRPHLVQDERPPLWVPDPGPASFLGAPLHPLGYGSQESLLTDLLPLLGHHQLNLLLVVLDLLPLLLQLELDSREL